MKPMIRVLPKKLPAPLSVWELCNLAEKVINSPSNLARIQKQVADALVRGLR